MKKKTISQLKKEADKYWSQYIRLRDSDKYGIGECITCGAKKHWKQQQCGHFVSRSCNALRYDDENTNLQCVGCNMFKSGEQYLYSKALDLKYGDGTAEKLHAQRHKSHKFTAQELQDIIDEAKANIKEYDK